MAHIQAEEVNGIETRFVPAQDGIRIYLLPNVPMNAGKIPKEGGFDLEGALESFPLGLRERVRKIGIKYQGRQLDATSILLYANERGQFEDYAQRLENKPKDFEFIHPDLMMARTDVTAFFMKLYADLGIAPKAEAESAERQVRDYGAGVVVMPR
jgi:hypothetical protein